MGAAGIPNTGADLQRGHSDPPSAGSAGILVRPRLPDRTSSDGDPPLTTSLLGDKQFMVQFVDKVFMAQFVNSDKEEDDTYVPHVMDC